MSVTDTLLPDTAEPGHARSPVATWAPIAIVAVLLALVPVFVGDSRTWMGLATGMLLFACYATAFNVIFGSTGQLFLCVGALAGVSGYATPILADEFGVPGVVALVVGTALSALLGGLFSWVSVRRSLGVIFTGIVTLTFSLGFHNLLLGQRELTGGETGLRIQVGGDTVLRELVPAYLVFLGLLVGYLVLYRLLQRSSFGWAFSALRDDPVAAELAGVDVARYRIWAGTIGSAMLGLAGGLWAITEGFVSPTTFAFGEVDVETLVILAFGGIGTLLGPVIGSVALTVLDELLRDAGQLRVAIFGAILVALFLGFRSGVGPAVGRLARRVLPTSLTDRFR
ncbi:branched-chain amino acid ABC transporter permease [Salsipaludibacter albus]|uniref:branched-chain amino acid ABC transporter permease n=1 Tax=Salsipaludibacter albus TaxID=2849650 RepID=UPI001EE4A07D|nr:branched-chain amino acid ABC transporter permease [Salsipaludibacter albus]MBY5164462.1 branched-chain amino acid ABC transporter permease [Salsipaludibacter albus]